MMQGWIEGLQASIDFIEQHLDEPLDVGEIAGKAALSPFYFQRIFGAMCGLTVGDYIRARRTASQKRSSASTASPRHRPASPAHRFAPWPRCISKYHWREEV